MERGFREVLAEACVESEGEHQHEKQQVEEPGCQMVASRSSCG
jgi:hypothetical protein